MFDKKSLKPILNFEWHPVSGILNILSGYNVNLHKLSINILMFNILTSTPTSGGTKISCIFYQINFIYSYDLNFKEYIQTNRVHAYFNGIAMLKQ